MPFSTILAKGWFVYIIYSTKILSLMYIQFSPISSSEDPQHLEKQLEEHPRTVLQVIQEDNKTLLSRCSFAFSRLYPMNQDVFAFLLLLFLDHQNSRMGDYSKIWWRVFASSLSQNNLDTHRPSPLKPLI